MNLAVSNFLSKLKNASLIQKKKLVLDFHTSFLPLIEILYKEGRILSYNKHGDKLIIHFRYFYNLNSLKKIKLISTISKQVYLNKFDIYKILEKNKLLVFSTSKGLLTSTDCKKLGIGGIFIFIC